MRWWDGGQWTPETHGRNPVEAQTRLIASLGVGAFAIIGIVLASFTSVSLATGTGTVWVGVALAVVGAVVALCLRQVPVWLKVVACLLAALCVASAVYDEVQLNHKRQQLEHILDGP